MAGQSDALALAQSILENKRREAEKLKRNRLVLEEDVSAGMLDWSLVVHCTLVKLCQSSGSHHVMQETSMVLVSL
jgi:hypothetical protein